jgi:GNAT superfamily N-acetyltransferase
MPAPDIHIRPVISANQLAAARAIIAEYIQSISDIASTSFAHQNVDKELADLPGVYIPPRGGLWLACSSSHPHPVGCIALRPVVSHLPPSTTANIGEIKRMYTRPTARGMGIARQLCTTLIAAARAAGYRHLWLDSDPELRPALHLYHSLGFVPIPRYNHDPDPKTLYLGMPL